MRQLLNTLFVLSEDAYLSVNGENVVISREQKEVARFPLHTLEGILCFSYAGASPALMGACVQRGVDIAFFSPRGQFWHAPSVKSMATSSCGKRRIACPMIPIKAAATPAGSSSARSITPAGSWSAPRVTTPSVCPWKRLKQPPHKWRSLCRSSPPAKTPRSCSA